MTKHYIDIVGKWAFIFAYNIEEKALGEVGEWLEALGAEPRDIFRAQRVLTRMNTGLTYSNTSLRMSVMCIGRADSETQWLDTIVHEIDHLKNAIINYYDVDNDSEDAAYLQGFIMKKIMTELKADGYSFGWLNND